MHPKPSPQVTLAASSSSQAVTSESSCEETSSRASRFKIRKRIIVGNVSKYIPVDKREERDQSTHKWMIYVRGTKEEPYIESFVKKVWFFLHPSYRPNDLVEVNQPPFHLTRRGWGEFPVRTQLHFHDVRNKRVDIIHTLKLDKTYTGLQTLGAETVVDILIYKPELLPCSLDEDGALETRQSPNKDIDMGGYVIAHNEDDKSRVVTSENVAVSGCETPAKALHCRNPHMVFTGVPSPTEISEEEGQKGKNCDDKFVSSFINDHGAYFATSNIDIVKSEHSYQAECPSLENCAGEKPLNTDIVNVTSYSEKLVRIKEEPLEETDRNDSCYSLKLNQKLNSSNVCSDTINQFKISQSLDELGCNSKLLVGDEDMVDISKSLNLEVNALVSSSKHNSTLMSDINIKPESDVEKDEKAESEIVYSVPGHHMLSFSEGSSVATNVVPDNQNLHQQNSINSLSLSSCTCVSSGNSSVSSSSISDLKEFDKDKTVSQSQSTNGVTTFVKCVDKQGNLYLIPLTVFLKMNPGAQLSAPPNSTHFSNLSSPSSSACSSLLKTSRVGGNIPASSTTTNATPLIMVSGISSGIKTMSDIPSIITSNSTSLGPACQKLTSSSPSVVTFPSALNAQGTSQQSLLLSNSKMPNIIQTSGLPRSLLSQHSISLLSGVSKLKKSQSVNNFSTSTSKTMISCLAKSRHTVEKVLPSGTLPLR